MIPNLGIAGCVILVRWSLPSSTSRYTENSTALFGWLKSNIVSLNMKSVFGLYTRDLCTNVTHRLLDLLWIQYGKGAQHTSTRMSSIYEIW
jgi:hypothetical protein